jgi:transposase
VVINMARPSKLTPQVQQRLVEAIRAGNYYEAACGFAGIHYSTFRNWMIRGEKAKSGKYKQFFEAIIRAEQEAEVRMVAQWQKHMPEDYRAIRDFLERRHPERWGRKRLDIEHSGNIGIKIVDDV